MPYSIKGVCQGLKSGRFSGKPVKMQEPTQWLCLSHRLAGDTGASGPWTTL